MAYPRFAVAEVAVDVSEGCRCRAPRDRAGLLPIISAKRMTFLAFIKAYVHNVADGGIMRRTNKKPANPIRMSNILERTRVIDMRFMEMAAKMEYLHNQVAFIKQRLTELEASEK